MTERLCERDCTLDDGTPRLATHGRYCTRCWGRLDFPLSQASELAQHLIGSIIPLSGFSEDRVDGSRDAPLPLNHAAFDDASELYAMLVYWGRVFAGILQQKEPSHTAGAWRNDRGTIIGLPTDITPESAGTQVGGLATWIRDRLDLILATVDHTDDIEAFTDQLADVYRMNARWSRVERPAYSKMPCPRQDCGQKIAVYPPAFPGDARRIVCRGGHWYPEEEYEHLLLVFQQVRAEAARTERTVRHLVKKYGIGA